jgi:CDP-diglyceride synthetase
MGLFVYGWEIFERTIVRYIWFSIVLGFVLILSILNNNAPWAIIILFLVWWYFYYSSSINKTMLIKTTEDWLLIWDKIRLWETITWYVLEVNKNNWEIKNIVFLWTKNHNIYTISDNMDNLKIFIESLEQYVKMLPWYEQTFREKITRKFQI